MFHELVVSQIEIVRGRHMWNGAKTEVETRSGNLQVWKTGENGGGSETWHAYLHVGKEGRLHSVTRLVALADTYGILRGDCMKTSRVPDPVFQDGEIVGYKWDYSPSTN